MPNPYEPTTHSTPPETSTQGVGRSCPICDSPQTRLSMMMPARRCKTCGTHLTVRLPRIATLFWLAVAAPGVAIIFYWSPSEQRRLSDNFMYFALLPLVVFPVQMLFLGFLGKCFAIVGIRPMSHDAVVSARSKYQNEESG